MSQLQSNPVHEIMSEEELLGFLRSLGIPSYETMASLHEFNLNSHLIQHEGASVEVLFNRRTHKYLVAVW